MKKYSLISGVMLALLVTLTMNSEALAQCKPMIKIDGKATVVNPNDDFGMRFPFWLKEGQTVAVGSSVSSISVIEFTENGTSLEYAGVYNITSTTPVTVPDGKVWKLVSVAMENNSSTYKKVTFAAGTYTWQVPACAEEICIEVWGGGGSGNFTTGSLSSGSGGGGGGFGSECFAVTPGTSYTVNVGLGGAGGSANVNGGNGGPTNVASLISATGGGGGTINSTGGNGGAGGTSSAQSSAPGASGLPGIPAANPAASGSGGAAGNGGEGAPSASGSAGSGLPGAAPGGGGSGGQRFNSSGYVGGKGGDGRVIISW